VRRFHCEHPLILTGIFLVAVNDHILKQSVLAGAVTGKLSDFAGLFFFPFLLVDLVSLVRRSWQDSPRLFLGAAVFTGFAFVALKCSPLALELYRNLYGLFDLHVSVVRDRTDLSALIMLPLSVSFHRHLRGRFHAIP
jgi:hypothetical protein